MCTLPCEQCRKCSRCRSRSECANRDVCGPGQNNKDLNKPPSNENEKPRDDDTVLFPFRRTFRM